MAISMAIFLESIVESNRQFQFLVVNAQHHSMEAANGMDPIDQI